jgi:hypothetical protein
MSTQEPNTPDALETPTNPPPDQAPSVTPEHPTPTGDNPDVDDE